MNNNLEKLYHIKFRCVSVCESIKGTDIVHVNVIPTILWDDNLEELTYILDANDEKYTVGKEFEVAMFEEEFYRLGYSVPPEWVPLQYALDEAVDNEYFELAADLLKKINKLKND